ncbi:MAG: hypothetical protein AAFX05_10085 [Planctomycetota bacterium]
MNRENDHNPEITPELRGLEQSLDALGARDRAAAPSTLEDRIFARTRAELRAEQPAVIARIGPIELGPLRIAAMVALAAVGVLATVIMLNQPTQTDLIAEDLLFAESLGLELEDEGEPAIDAVLASIESDLDDFWSTDESYDWLIDAALETGSL